MGHIIPAGTGFEQHRKSLLKPLVEVVEEEAQPEESLTEEENPLLSVS